MRNVKYSYRVSAINWLCTANKFKSLKLYFGTRSALSEVECGEHALMFFIGKHTFCHNYFW